MTGAKNVLHYCDVVKLCYVSVSSKFSYQSDIAYKYAYETNVITSMPGANTDHSSLHLRADVTIQALSPCEMVLSVNSQPASSRSKKQDKLTIAYKII